MEAFLQVLLPRLLPEACSHAIHPFEGKSDLRKKLRQRLSGYQPWLPEGHRVIVLVDRDGCDCRKLMREPEKAAADSRLRTRAQADGASWQVANCIVIQELEAWYFGDWQATRDAYPKVSPRIPARAKHRNPDAIQKPSHALETILRRKKYFLGGLVKMQAARKIAAGIDPQRNQSPSFAMFFRVILEAVGTNDPCSG